MHYPKPCKVFELPHTNMLPSTASSKMLGYPADKLQQVRLVRAERLLHQQPLQRRLALGPDVHPTWRRSRPGE